MTDSSFPPEPAPPDGRDDPVAGADVEPDAADPRPLRQRAHLLREARRVRRERERERRRARRRRTPRELGLVKCPHCGWHRDPVPEAASTPEAFLEASREFRAHCLCTAPLCPTCGEPYRTDVPYPRYYDPGAGRIRHVSALVLGARHSRICGSR